MASTSPEGRDGLRVPDELTWSDLHHRELTARQVYDVLRLRQQVFVVEQQCAYADIDDQDLSGATRHLLGTDPDGALVAYARMLAPTAGQPACHLGRILTAARVRGRGWGGRLTEAGIDACRRHWPEAPIEIAAQAHLQNFYASFGFVATSEPYDWDGIDHVDMIRRVAT